MTDGFAQVISNYFGFSKLLRDIDLFSIAVSKSSADNDGALDDLAAKVAALHGGTLRLLNIELEDATAEISRYYRGQKADSPTRLSAIFRATSDQLKATVEAAPPSAEKARVALWVSFSHQPSVPFASFILRDRTSSLEDENMRRDVLDRTIREGSWGRAYHSFEAIRAFEALDQRVYSKELDELYTEFRGRISQGVDLSLDRHPPHPIPLESDDVWMLWLCARHAPLVSAVFGPARRLLHRLLPWQQREGWWTLYPEKPVPTANLTAQLVHALAVFGDHNDRRVAEAIDSGLRWLLTQQRDDGGWQSSDAQSDSDTVTTAIVVELLKRRDPTAYAQRIEAGERFILSRQAPYGLWNEMGRDEDYFTVLFLEVLEGSLPPFQQVDAFLSLAREMIFKSEELLRSDQNVDVQLGTIAAHHAVEMFLYGLFASIEPPEGFMRADGKTTIGLREALGALERRLKRDGILADAQGLPLRDQVSLLAVARDAIVHQGQTISQNEAVRRLGTARAFISRQSQDLLGSNLLH